MSAIQRFYPLMAVVAIAFSVVAVIAGQLGPDATLDWLNVTISEYAVADRGGITEAGMMALGLGSLALLGALRSTGAPVRGLPEWLLRIWSGALIVAAIVPTVPLGLDMTTEAQVHRYVSVAAFVALPAAAALLASRFAANRDWKPVARTMEWLALAAGSGWPRSPMSPCRATGS